MNFFQKFGILCLILITVGYVYFSFFVDGGLNLPNYNRHEPEKTDIKQTDNDGNVNTETSVKSDTKIIKIYVTDSKGNLRSVNRKCDAAVEKSCFSFAIKELIAAPTDWEKNKGLSSEIPPATKVLSLREGSNNILIDLSSPFESGGGAESIYIRVKQLIKTAQANTRLPVYLYINGKQADVIGGEGIMLKQPLTEKSLDD